MYQGLKDMSQDDVYEVNSIVDKRLVKNSESEEEFKIRWQGYGPNDDTWQTESDCIPSCYDLIINLETTLFQRNQRKFLRSEIIGWKRDPSNRIKLLVEWQTTTASSTVEFYYSSVIQTHVTHMLIDYYEENIPVPDQNPELAHFYDSLFGTTAVDESDKPQQIIAFALFRGVRWYLISWMDQDECSVVNHNFLRTRYPELLIEFYEKHLLPRENLV